MEELWFGVLTLTVVARKTRNESPPPRVMVDVRVDLCDLLVTVPGEFEEVVRVKLRNAKPRC